MIPPLQSCSLRILTLLLIGVLFDSVLSIVHPPVPSLPISSGNILRSQLNLNGVRKEFVGKLIGFEQMVVKEGDARRQLCSDMLGNVTEWFSDKFNQPKDTALYSISDTIKISNKYLSNDAVWDFVGIDNDVSVWKLNPLSISMNREDKQWPCMKSSAIVKGDPKKLVEYLMDSSKVPEYNKHCAGRTDVEKISKKSKIVWNRTSIPLAIKSYDFCTLMHYYQKPSKEYILVSRGVKHPLIPVHKDYSRSENIIGLNILRPVKTNKKKDAPYTEITCISHVRYGGTLPYIIQKSIFRGTVKYLHNLKEKAKTKF